MTTEHAHGMPTVGGGGDGTTVVPGAPTPPPLPTIICNAEEARVVDEIAAALSQNEPNLFQRANRLVTTVAASSSRGVQRDGGVNIVAVRSAWMRDKIARHCRLVHRTIDTESHTVVNVHIHPAEWMASNLLSRLDYPGINELIGVSPHPILTASGLNHRRGYDAESGWLVLPPEGLPAVSDAPTAEEIHRAKELLHEPLRDFPFAHPAGESAMLALLLTILARPAIHGPTPLFLADAATAGSGKGKLISVIIAIATGAPPATIPEAAEGDEQRKRIFSILMAGDPVALFDNINRLGGAALDALLTTTIMRDRILGKSEAATLPNYTVWVATGNNVEVVGDTRRRVLPIRLEPREERPDARTGFVHADLEDWVRQNQPELLWAALTLLSAWHGAGRPAGQVDGRPLEPWGSYEAWSGVVRSCLVHHGYPDPDACRMGETFKQNPELEALGVALKALRQIGLPTKAHDLLTKAESGELGEAAQNIIPELALGPKGYNARTLGKKLERWNGRVAGDLRLRVKSSCGTNHYSAAKVNPVEYGNNGDNGSVHSPSQIEMDWE